MPLIKNELPLVKDNHRINVWANIVCITIHLEAVICYSILFSYNKLFSLSNIFRRLCSVADLLVARYARCSCSVRCSLFKCCAHEPMAVWPAIYIYIYMYLRFKANECVSRELARARSRSATCAKWPRARLHFRTHASHAYQYNVRIDCDLYTALLCLNWCSQQ